MYKGDPQQVTLSVGLPGEGANEAAQTAAQGPGEARTLPSARVGRRMKADLYGANFEVKSQTPETQVLTPSATWIWQVTPRAEGVQQLELRTAVIFADQSGKTYELASTPQLYSVTVKIEPKPPEPLFQRILDTLTGGEGLLKAIAANIAALAGLIAAVAGLRAAWKKLRGS